MRSSLSTRLGDVRGTTQTRLGDVDKDTRSDPTRVDESGVSTTLGREKGWESEPQDGSTDVTSPSDTGTSNAHERADVTGVDTDR